MGDVLICADSMRSPEMRHEVPVAIPDPFLYARARRRSASSSSARSSSQRIHEAAPGIEVDLARARSALDELLRERHARSTRSMLEVLLRAPAASSASRAPSCRRRFPLELADHLRANGVDLARRPRALRAAAQRRKNADRSSQGLRRAQRACEAALDVAREMLRNATPTATLVLDGEPLTVRADQGRRSSASSVRTAPPPRSSSSRTARRPRSATRSGTGAILPGRADRRSTSSRGTARPASTPT